MSEKISPTIEHYLGMLLILERDGEPVSGARLAGLLGVTPPTVTNTLKRMARDGLVAIDAGHVPHLTGDGHAAAQAVVRKHMLAEWMLTRMLSWSKLHKEAHELEHAISEEVEAALLQQLDNPQVCPHGNPLPGHEDAVSGWVPLTAVPAHSKAVVRRIHEFAEDDPAILSYLEEKHIAPGQEITVLETLPFNQTITICIQDEVVTLGYALARYLYCLPLNQTQ